MRTALNVANRGSIQSMDSDGFTINWLKQGAPTGLTVVRFIAYK
jgi:hypothetical protein